MIEQQTPDPTPGVEHDTRTVDVYLRAVDGVMVPYLRCWRLNHKDLGNGPTCESPEAVVDVIQAEIAEGDTDENGLPYAAPSIDALFIMNCGAAVEASPWVITRADMPVAEFLQLPEWEGW